MMERRSFLASLVALGSSWTLGRSLLGQALAPTPMPSPSDQSELIRQAAAQFLQTLGPRRSARATFAFPAGQIPAAAEFPSGRGDFKFVGEKYGESMWTNFPVSDVPRPGLRLGELAAPERAAFHGLLQVVLSKMGYQKVLDIMAADQVLADEGQHYAVGIDTYTLALFGQPGATAPWMLQFGGHHLGLNVTFVGDQAVLAPLHTGVLPSRFAKDGKTVRALGRENDRSFDLLGSFTPEQRQAAIIDHDISDLVCGPGRPNARPSPQGVRGADMTDVQRTILFDLIGEWAGVLNEAQAAQRLADLRCSLPDTCFAWSGPTTHGPEENGTAYFRIHGPSVLIEYAPQGNQGGYKLHDHTVMRDLTNDYGKRLVA